MIRCIFKAITPLMFLDLVSQNGDVHHLILSEMIFKVSHFYKILEKSSQYYQTKLNTIAQSFSRGL
uniref:Uncharacterized protein n=1 Tax=Nelumbo nucifera TaxID=4432 RepID=A0A822YHR7_NELNU|nr:TPA_asm: hypothetical protein HUJ06_010524 [Nelumbo nucifera]